MTVQLDFMRTAAKGIAKGAGALIPGPQFIVQRGESKGTRPSNSPVYGLPVLRGHEQHSH